MARKILLADDSVTAQNMGRRILGDAGYEVITVNNGSAALKRIAEQKPDLIVLDVYMPGYGGLEVCQRLKENPETARIPVLLTVGKLEPFKAEDARRVRADAFVVKPFEASELLTALTKLEDRIVPRPEPHKSGRFAKAIAAVENGNARKEEKEFGDTDLGWKNRIIIPKGAPKVEEPDTETDSSYLPVPSFRDFSRLESNAAEAAPENTEPSVSKLKVIYEEEEIARSLLAGAPAGIPPDITPEEISAITAAAAALSRQTQSAASGSTTPAGAPFLEYAVPAAPEIAAAALQEIEAPKVEAVTPPPSVKEQAVEQAVEKEQEVEVQPPATFTPVASVAAEAAVADSKLPVEVVSPQIEAPAPSPVPSFVLVVKAGDVKTPEVGQAQEKKTEPQEDHADVLAALASLTPSSGESFLPTTPSPAAAFAHAESTIPAVIAELVAVGELASGPRWLADEVALSPGEVTMSLGHEMEKAYAAYAAAEAARANVPPAILHQVMSAAQAEITALPEVEYPHVPEPIPSNSLDSIAPEPQLTEVRSEIELIAELVTPELIAAVQAPEEGEPAVKIPAGRPVIDDEEQNLAQGEKESIETEPTVVPAESQPESVETEPVENRIEAISAPEPEPAAELAYAAAASGDISVEAVTTAPPIETPKERELAAAWANWRQIRETSPGKKADDVPGAPSVPSMEELKQARAFQDIAVPAKVRAQPEIASLIADDSEEISNIVDSVLADLKPKLMKEIARKMAKEAKDKK